MSIASNLRRIVDEQGVTAASIAREIGAETSSVRKYLSGAVRPSDRVLVRLARCLGCTPEEIMYGGTRRVGKLTTEEVSRYTGIDPLSIRIGLQRGIWPFGVAYKREGSSRYVYEYDPEAVLRFANARRELRGDADEKRERQPGPVAGIAD